MISAQAIESVAPDQAALAAASKIKRTAWAALGKDEGRQLAWGECSGSGSAPYRISLDMNDLAAKCTCPSRKFPCKHALGMMLVALDEPQALAPTPAPEWVLDWLSRRRPSASARPPGAEASAARPNVSLERASEPEEPGPTDEKAEARAAAQRERVRAKREESVLAGLDELDRWIGDEIDAGLAAFPQRAPQRCRIAAQRLVDAKAPALATRLDALPAELLGLPEDERGRHAIEVLGSLHLLAEAYRRQERLPASLRSDVRRLVGWTVERQELLDEPSALRVTAPWLVAAVHSEVQPDRLRRIETWLMRGDEGDPGFAVLIDFVPLASGQGDRPTFRAKLLTRSWCSIPRQRRCAPSSRHAARRGISNGRGRGCRLPPPSMLTRLSARAIPGCPAGRSSSRAAGSRAFPERGFG